MQERPSRSPRVIYIDAVQQTTYDFLLVIHCNNVCLVPFPTLSHNNSILIIIGDIRERTVLETFQRERQVTADH